MSEIIDLTLKVESKMPTCGTSWHQNVQIEQMGTLEEVGRNTSSILLGSHSGTHMDAPRHFIDEGSGIDSIDLNILCGDVNIVNLRNKEAGDIVHLSDIKRIKITTRMIFAFGWYKHWKSERYYKHFPYFSEEAINYLIKNGMRLMALDTPSPDCGDAIHSIDGRDSDSPNHKMMLKNGIVIVEYLNNTDLIDLSKKYEIIALPLRVVGVDGCPSRVILREVHV